MANSFVQRRIEIAIRLAPKTGTTQPTTFTESGTDTVTVKGARTRCQISNSGSPVGNRADVKIFGLTPSLMNQLATLGLVLNLVPKNVITITAGDESGMSTVFSGTIWSAYGDYSAQPNVPFHITALAGAADAVVAAPATSYTGKASVETIMGGLARQMSMGFRNYGVSSSLTSPYFNGSLMVQARQCAEHAGINFSTQNGMEIWPRGGNRDTPDIPEISQQTGMVNYPAFTQQGIIVKTLFNPKIAFGGLVKVNSDVLTGIAQQQRTTTPSANTFPTQWAVRKLDLMIESQQPKGDWMSIVYGYNPGATIIPPP